MTYIIDTNILLDYPQIVEDGSNQMIVATSVLKELDGLKKHVNPEVAFNARRAAVYISKNLVNLDWYFSCEDWNIPVDDQLIEIAKETGGTLLTNDVYLKVKAILKNIPTKGYSNKDDYTGVEYFYINSSHDDDYKIAQDIIEKNILPENVSLCENQYFIIKDTNCPIVDEYGDPDFKVYASFCYRNGKLNELTGRRIKNSCIDQIFPRNEEQACLFDALKNSDNTIIYAGGGFGKGKSFILNNYALQELERDTIKKIVYIPNNAFTENTMDIGALPGELLAKIEGQIGPLIDLVGIDRVQDMQMKDQLEIVPMNSIRGRSFTNSIIIVNESQNLTEDHIKLLIGRCGEGTRIFFDGDIKQTDSQIFRNKNGLRLLLNLRRSPVYSKMFAAVKLIKTERSKTAQAAAYLDENIWL